MDHFWRPWLFGFGLTISLELPIVLWMLKRSEPRWERRLALGMFANLSTHPLVWMYFPLLPIAAAPRVALSEFWAFGLEALFYAMFIAKGPRMRGVWTSIVANATSFGIGWIVVNRFTSWFL